ncbi:hypothetical protein JB92DRAFT_2834153 [Gautieria morchelliformis]|nr:hypothetical protein JB92DRAFT_2834153 [Gautieria morchelliformis]
MSKSVAANAGDWRAQATPPGTATPGTCPKRHCFPTLISQDKPRSINSLMLDTFQEVAQLYHDRAIHVKRPGHFAGNATRHASIWEAEALKQALIRAVPHLPSIRLGLITCGAITVRTFMVLTFHGRDVDRHAPYGKAGHRQYDNTSDMQPSPSDARAGLGSESPGLGSALAGSGSVKP